MIDGNRLINEAYSGKTLLGFEFGQNEEGNRTAMLGQKIVKARIGCEEGDAGIFLTLENGEDVFLYANEEIVEESK